MEAEKYIDGVVKKIKCSTKRRNEIKRELLSEWTQRLEQGEALENIIKEAGSQKEMADGFNEGLSVKEKRAYRIQRILISAVVAALFLFGMYGLMLWYMPRPLDIETSTVFQKETIENAMKQTIELVDSGDYEALKASAVDELKPILTKETMEKAKISISPDWGERKSFGTFYVQEILQKGKHFVVGEITVTYENAAATYRLTYDETGKLAGIYVR